MVDPKTEKHRVIIERVARNLGIESKDLFNDPAFRDEIGANELDKVEAELRDKEGSDS